MSLAHRFYHDLDRYHAELLARSVRPPGPADPGYLSPSYAYSLSEWGIPLQLPHSGGWVVQRMIPGYRDSDAMGCYPLFCCQDWDRLPADMTELDVVSLTVVTDPFGDYDETLLRRCFPDRCVRFKEHYAIDLENPQVSKHHRRYVRKAHEVGVICDTLNGMPAEWNELHGNLVAKYGIRGIQAFSPQAFAAQFMAKGMTYFRAQCGGSAVAGMITYLMDNVVQAHVWGCNDRGYEVFAPYALIDTAIQHFQPQARWLNLQGLPGANDAGHEGIRSFKAGWTSVTRPSWLCGRILDPKRYAEIAEETGTTQARYFPAYRDGEMA